MTRYEEILKLQERIDELALEMERIAAATRYNVREQIRVAPLYRELKRQKEEREERLAALNRAKEESTQNDAHLADTESEFSSVYSNKAESIEHSVAQTMTTQAPPGTNRNKKRVKKIDLSRYLDGANLTEKQYECASLRWEYHLNVSQIARELQRHRATVDQHIKSAQTKMRALGQYEKMRKRLSQKQPGE